MHHLQRHHCVIGPLTIRLVDGEQIGDLQHAGLDRLHLVAQARRFHDDGRVRRAGDIDLGLPHADRLHQDALEAGGIEHGDHIGRGVRQPAQIAARRHAADEDAGIARQIAHAHPIAQQRAA